MAINEKLERAIGGLFEASMGERPWSAALTALGECFAGGVYLTIFDTVRQTPVLAVTCNRISPVADADYEQHYGAIDPRRALVMQRPIGEVLACHEHFDATFVRGNEFYNDFLLRHGFRYAMGVGLSSGGDEVAMLGFQRRRSEGYYAAKEQQALRLALPHLERALRVRRLFSAAAESGARRQAMLDALPVAAFLVDSRCRILERNRAAEELASKGRLVRGEHLRPPRLCEAAQLDRLVHNAVAATATQGAGGGVCPLSGADGRCLYLSVMPVAPANTAALGVPAALVLIADSERRQSPGPGSLRAVLGLTAAEQAVAEHLLAGLRVAEIAARRGVSQETIRSQIKEILAKAGCARQVDLVRKLAQIGAWAGDVATYRQTTQAPHRPIPSANL